MEIALKELSLAKAETRQDHDFAQWEREIPGVVQPGPVVTSEVMTLHALPGGDTAVLAPPGAAVTTVKVTTIVTAMSIVATTAAAAAVAIVASMTAITKVDAIDAVAAVAAVATVVAVAADSTASRVTAHAAKRRARLRPANGRRHPFWS